MKKITTILSILILALSLQASVQTKKSKTQPKRVSSLKKAVARQQPEETKTAAVTAKRDATVTDDYYKTAFGVKFLYGISLTAKHFINNKAALEAVLQYRNHSGFGTEFNFTGLYEYHGNITGAGGLRWYAGGGGYAGYYSFDNGINDDGISSFTAGVAGVIGLEYKIKNAPLAISVDWQPLYIVNGNSGLATENGGVGIKYAF